MGKMSDKLRAIATAVSDIEKQFGKGAIMPLGGPEIVDVPVISTGSLGLDLALGVGGLPRGRVIEIFGPESSGKTTLTLHAIAAAQRAGGVCAFIDAEHALDVSYARRIGVDLGSLLVSQPDCGEQALEIADQLVRTGAVDLIIVDSVDALTPRAEIEGDMGDSHMGLQARLTSQALRKITAVAAKMNATVVFLHQPRPFTGSVFASGQSVGGNALKFYASVRIALSVAEKLGGAIRVNAKVVKNKVAAPFREALFTIAFGEGIDTLGELVDLGGSAGLIGRDHEWFFLGDRRLGADRAEARGWLRVHPEEADAMRINIIEVMRAATKAITVA